MKNNNNNGFYISVDGGDGVGKTHAVEFLRREFSKTHDVVVASSLRSNPVSIGVRAIITNKENNITQMAEAYLLLAAHYENYYTVVRPAVLAGKLVIGDRSILSAMAYQAHANNVLTGDNRVTELFDREFAGMNSHHQLIIRSTLEKASSNIAIRGEALDKMESKPKAYHDAVDDYFNSIASPLGNTDFIYNNGTLAEFEAKLLDFAYSMNN